MPLMFISLSRSANLNPTNWVRHAFTNTVGTGESIDFPTLGLDKNGIYISLQFHSNSVHRGYRIQCFKKPDVFSASYVLPGPLSVTNVSGSATGDLDADVIHPAYNFDSTLASNGSAWFVAKGRLNATDDKRTICYRRVVWIGSTPTWVGTDWQVVTGGYTDYYDVPHQPSGGLLAPTSDFSVDLGRGGSRLAMAVVRKTGTTNFLWTCHTVGLDGPDSSYNSGQVDRTAVQWLKFQATTTTLTYADHDRIFDNQTYSGLNTPYWYYYPSLNVDSDGDVVIGFSGARAAEHISAYYSGVKSSGWSLDKPILLARGELGADQGSWADYSATTMDPNDDSFWTIQPHAVRESGSAPIGAIWGDTVSQITSYP